MKDNKSDHPKWFKIGDKLCWPLIGMGLKSLDEYSVLPIDLQPLGYNALCHHAGCLQASMMANEKGKHSAAICLVRQSIEALTIAEIALQQQKFAEPLLRAWSENRKSHGELRQALEQQIWPKYGNGLWSEPWSEFYGNLARAVQPYAHYTPELEGWLYQTVKYDGGRTFLGMTGLTTYDALQATRVTLFHMLLTWMLGRMLLNHGGNSQVRDQEKQIHELGIALGASKLLVHQGEWWTQLAPHMLFKPGKNWMDDA